MFKLSREQFKKARMIYLENCIISSQSKCKEIALNEIPVVEKIISDHELADGFDQHQLTSIFLLVCSDY